VPVRLPALLLAWLLSWLLSWLLLLGPWRAYVCGGSAAVWSPRCRRLVQCWHALAACRPQLPAATRP
jgi:hypothetical protein